MLDLLELYEWMRASDVDRIELDSTANRGAMTVIALRTNGANGGREDDVESVVDMKTVEQSEVTAEAVSILTLANLAAGLNRRTYERANPRD